MLGILGLAIGLLVLNTGLYYLKAEGHDGESKKYTIVSIAAVAVAGLLVLVLRAAKIDIFFIRGYTKQESSTGGNKPWHTLKS